MVQAKKQYKRTINKLRTKFFNRKVNNKLRNMKDKVPKKFWFIIQNKKKDSLKDISMNSLFEHFKNLNECNDNEAGIQIANDVL